MEHNLQHGIDAKVLSRIYEIVFLKEQFFASVFVKNKVEQLHKQLMSANRTTLVVGISGGVDSAVVLGLLKELDKTYPNIYTILPVVAPIYKSEGTTDQAEATDLGFLVCNAYAYVPKYYSLGDLSRSTANELRIDTPYIQQQVDYWLRPIAFYKVAMKCENSILISTTNGSEWSLGWFSQYLDIFGIHPIIELLKTDVYLLAHYLNVPSEVLEVRPKGGLASGLTDEEALGFSYADLEYFLKGSESLPEDISSSITNHIKQSHFKRYRFNLDFIKGKNE